MRLPESLFKSLGPAPRWESRLFSADVINAARAGNRSLWPDAASQIAGFDVNAMVGAEEWAQSEQMALFRAGTGALGIPQGLVSSVSNAMVPLVLNQPSSTKQLVAGLSKAAIGIVVDALAVFPVVGSVARGISALADVLVALSSASPKKVQEFFPPAQVYADDADDEVVNDNVLAVTTTSNWTPLFLPRMSGKLSLVRNDAGWVLSAGGGPQGAGFIPGSRQISDQIQVFWAKKQTVNKSGWQASNRDVGDFYPGAAKLAFGLSEQVQTPSAFLYAVDPIRILSAWQDHFASVVAYATDLWHGKGLAGTGLEDASDEHRHLIVQQIVAPFFVTKLKADADCASRARKKKTLSAHCEYHRGILGAQTWSPGNTKLKSIVDVFVRPWVKRVRQRQRFFLDTTVCAVVDPDGGAFASNRLLNTIRVRNQKLLLDSAYLRDVNLADVIDQEYRAEVFGRRAGGTFQVGGSGGPGPKKWPVVTADSHGFSEVPGEPPPEPPRGPPAWEKPGTKDAGLVAGLIAMGLLGGGAAAGFGAALRRRRRG